jgi:hypothetical protein
LKVKRVERFQRSARAGHGITVGIDPRVDIVMPDQQSARYRDRNQHHCQSDTDPEPHIEPEAAQFCRACVRHNHPFANIGASITATADRVKYKTAVQVSF